LLYPLSSYVFELEQVYDTSQIHLVVMAWWQCNNK